MQLTLFDEIFDQSSAEDQMIEQALLRGGGFAGYKERIKDFLQTNPSMSDLADKLRSEYGTGGWGEPIEEGLHMTFYDANGMKLFYKQNGNGHEIKVTWSKAAQVFIKMVERGAYV